MRNTATFCALGFSVLIPATAFSIPIFDPGTSSTYTLTAAGDTWQNAEAAAASTAGGHLIHIHSSVENDLARAVSNNGSAWIGATDQAVEGEWRWSDDNTQFWSGLANGSAVGGQYANWNGGEPNNSGGENYAQISGGGGWNDLPNGVSLPGIVRVAGNQAAQTFNGHTYYVLTPNTNDNQEAAAVAMGGHLVRIDDAAENDFVKGIATLLNESVIIGATDKGEEGKWLWRDGTQFWQGAANGSPVGSLYNNWSPGGEPNDFGSGEDFAEIGTNGIWNDISDQSKFAVVEVVPEPATLGLLGFAGLLLARRRA